MNGAAYACLPAELRQKGSSNRQDCRAQGRSNGPDRVLRIPMPEKYRIGRGDILFSWSGNPDTSIDTFVWSFGPAWLNQHIFRVLPHQDNERAFVLATLRDLRPVFAEIARNKQTTGLGHVTADDMKRLLVVRPDARGMEAWNMVAGPLLERSFQNALEARGLGALRDTLLPRLLSGDLRLPD